MEIVCIVRYRISNRNRWFLLLFLGFDMSEAIWISEDDFSNTVVDRVKTEPWNILMVYLVKLII